MASVVVFDAQVVPVPDSIVMAAAPDQLPLITMRQIWTIVEAESATTWAAVLAVIVVAKNDFVICVGDVPVLAVMPEHPPPDVLAGWSGCPENAAVELDGLTSRPEFCTDAHAEVEQMLADTVADPVLAPGAEPNVTERNASTVVPLYAAMPMNEAVVAVCPEVYEYGSVSDEPEQPVAQSTYRYLFASSRSRSTVEPLKAISPTDEAVVAVCASAVKPYGNVTEAETEPAAAAGEHTRFTLSVPPEMPVTLIRNASNPVEAMFATLFDPVDEIEFSGEGAVTQTAVEGDV